MIGRVLVVVGACALVYACARDQAKQDFRKEAALERRVMVLEQRVQALESARKLPAAKAESTQQTP